MKTPKRGGNDVCVHTVLISSLKNLCLFTILKQFPTKDALSFYTALVPVPAVAEMLTDSWQTMHDAIETKEHISSVCLEVTVTCVHRFQHTQEVIYQRKRHKSIPFLMDDPQVTQGLLNKMSLSMERSKSHRTDRWIIH